MIPAPGETERPFVEPWPLDGWPEIAASVIAGRSDRLFPYVFMVESARKRLGVECVALDAGHLPALSRPAELVDAKVDCLASRTPRR